MTEANNTPVQQADPDKIEIENLDQFVAILTAWHTKKVAILQHMAKIPDGTEIIVEGQAPIIVTGDLLTGFLLGIKAGISELGRLPFTVLTIPEEPAPAAEEVAAVGDGDEATRL